MASFEQHISGAVISTGVLLVPLYSVNFIDMNQSLALLALGTIGGVLPDLDAEDSKPIQISFNILSIFLPLVMLLTIIKDISVIHILIMWFLSFIILKFGIFKIFLQLTTHRGVFHTIPMGVLCGLLTYIFFQTQVSDNITFSTLCGIFLFFGFMVHLFLDEIVSLNLFGIKVKNSFGTAMKLYDGNNLLGTIAVYILIFVSIYLYPIDTTILIELFDILKQIKL